MNHFWPRRPSPKGFSIENLAKKYREKLTKVSYERNKEEAINILEDKTQIQGRYTNLVENNSIMSNIHWANRDFSEYKEAA